MLRCTRRAGVGMRDDIVIFACFGWTSQSFFLGVVFSCDTPRTLVKSYPQGGKERLPRPVGGE